MTPIKDYIGKQFINKQFHFTCNCIMNLDVVGTVTDFEVIGNEIVLNVMSNNKLISIGLNTPALKIEEI